MRISRKISLCATTAALVLETLAASAEEPVLRIAKQGSMEAGGKTINCTTNDGGDAPPRGVIEPFGLEDAAPLRARIGDYRLAEWVLGAYFRGGGRLSPDTLYFTAGPNGQTDGLFGTITPVSGHDKQAAVN